MPDASERRQFARYPVQLPLLYKPGYPVPIKAGVGWTRNLSAGGACLELAESLQTKTPIRARLRTDRGAVDVEAEVVWAGEPAPMEGGILHGVAFRQMAPEHLQTLQALLATEGERRRAGVRLPLELPVTCRPKGQAGPPLQERTENLSRGGLLLRLPQPLPVETVVEVTLHSPHGALTVEGAVVWVDPPERRTPGQLIRHGLRFTALGWSTALSLGLVLAASS